MAHSAQLSFFELGTHELFVVTAIPADLLPALAPNMLIPAAAERLFQHWKATTKARKKGEELPPLPQTKLEHFQGDPVMEAARRLQTQPQHVLSTIKRFLSDLAK